MEPYEYVIPTSKRFFKIHELAGKRWPTVTEDEIYNWHDVGFKVPIAAEGWPQLVDTTAPNMWNKAPHWGEINPMAYWVFFPEFYSLSGPNSADLLMKYIDEETSAIIKRKGAKLLEALNFKLLKNSFFMIETDSSKGFAYNNRGVVDCIEFYDEQGYIHPPGAFDEKAGKFLLASMNIKKEDLLIKSSSVQFLEQVAPPLTSSDRRSKDVGLFKTDHKDTSPTTVVAEEDYAPANVGKPLEGWKAIAGYAGVSESTAKRNYKEVIKHTPAGKPFTTTAALDQFRIKTATKQNKRKTG